MTFMPKRSVYTEQTIEAMGRFTFWRWFIWSIRRVLGFTCVSHSFFVSVTLQCWEYGISLCRELAFQYETLYDYQSLSWIRVSKVLQAPSFCCSYQTSLLCDAGRWDFSASSVAAALWCEVHNVLITCAHPHSPRHAGDSGTRVINLLFTITLLHVFILMLQKMEAAYYDNIIEQQRIEPEFFRMGFYGRKFPFFLRVRLFLYLLCPYTDLVTCICAEQ